MLEYVIISQRIGVPFFFEIYLFRIRSLVIIMICSHIRSWVLHQYKLGLMVLTSMTCPAVALLLEFPEVSGSTIIMSISQVTFVSDLFFCMLLWHLWWALTTKSTCYESLQSQLLAPNTLSSAFQHLSPPTLSQHWRVFWLSFISAPFGIPHIYACDYSPVHLHAPLPEACAVVLWWPIGSALVS